MSILPDVLAHDLDIVFCGTAPGTASARQNAYYAGPGNAFWPTLFSVGLVPVALQPREFACVTRWKIGLTDLAKQAYGSDAKLSRAHFDVERFQSVIDAYRPRIVAFTSKRAALEFAGHSVEYGLLHKGGSTHFFVLPSPSGAARRYWSIEPWRELTRLRSSVCSGWTPLGCGE